MAPTPGEHGRRVSDGTYARQSPEQRRHRARVAAVAATIPARPTWTPTRVAT
jgi:hypothetical protein